MQPPSFGGRRPGGTPGRLGRQAKFCRRFEGTAATGFRSVDSVETARSGWSRFPQSSESRKKEFVGYADIVGICDMKNID